MLVTPGSNPSENLHSWLGAYFIRIKAQIAIDEFNILSLISKR